MADLIPGTPVKIRATAPERAYRNVEGEFLEYAHGHYVRVKGISRYNRYARVKISVYGINLLIDETNIEAKD